MRTCPCRIGSAADLARFAPRGTLTHGRLSWAGPAEAPTTFNATADFADIGLVAQDAFPGTTGLSGRLEATNEGGEIRIAGSKVTLDLPRVLAAPIAFDTLQSVVKWEHRDGNTKVKLEQLEIANADLSAGASGTYRTLASGPGEIEIVAHASRGDARQVHRYLPKTIGAVTRHWLETALMDGSAVDARLKIAGNLADFPFANGKGGKLTFTTKAKAVRLAYTEGWPAIDGIDADVRIDGTRLTIDAARGRVDSVEIGKTLVEIPDFAAQVPLLRIDGEAVGPIAGFLRYINESPRRDAHRTVHARRRSGGKRAPGAEDRATSRTAGGHQGRRRFCLCRFPVAHRRGPCAHEARRQAVVHRTRRQRARSHRGGAGRIRQARRDQHRRPDPVVGQRHGRARGDCGASSPIRISTASRATWIGRSKSTC